MGAITASVRLIVGQALLMAAWTSNVPFKAIRDRGECWTYAPEILIPGQTGVEES